MITPRPDLCQLGLFADALRLHAFLRAAYSSPESARRSVVRTSRLVTGRELPKQSTLGNLTVVVWNLDQCIRDGAFSLPLVIGSMPGSARNGPSMSELVAVCERLGMPSDGIVAEASRSLVEASSWLARQVGAGAYFDGVAAFGAPLRRRHVRAPIPPRCRGFLRMPIRFPEREHKPTISMPIWHTMSRVRHDDQVLRPAGLYGRATSALMRGWGRRARARSGGRKAPKSLMLCCAQESQGAKVTSDQAPGPSAVEAQAPEAPGTPPPPPSATPDGGQIEPAVGLDAPPEYSKTLAGNVLAPEPPKSDKIGPELCNTSP